MDRIRKLMALVVLLCAAGASLSAQDEYTVSGRVVDQLGPVIGATVVEQGTSNGASTDLDGSFALRVSGPDAKVEISCIGYAPQAYRASQVPETITLKEDAEFIDEVVVIGYGTVKKDDLTGYTLAIILACAIKVAGYYVAEALIYGNWVQPVLSIPGNLMQIGVAALIVLPMAGTLKKALKR